MDIDNFKETFRNQCREEVKEIYLESEQEGEFHPNLFNEKLINVWRAASMNGIDEYDFSYLVHDVIQANVALVTFPFDQPIAA
ncbi:hypothetical protein [Bacteriovorax sp. DB6_IX]|uniref:hypothetical protein n=1 Tax=Bacteriovorax sp. DB6_IX TaxID=1353530 RepID=UPI00038A39C1|nr:hypothetical protein [Bacteriovorax sp. DB6_IX]EQC50705.1 hypothetical protein M901_1710 [Bacteriovorax sp. DB6_IX]